MEKLSNSLIGIAGEYYVAAELSRRGFMASITLRNNDSIDIHASRQSDNSLIAIQVKTQQRAGASWLLNQKSEQLVGDNVYYIFVTLKGEQERPDFYIVPSKIVSQRAIDAHQEWLSKPGRNGQPHNDSTMRKFEDKKGEFLEKWPLLNGSNNQTN
ncbi:MAG: hypothetical protein ACTHMM_20300 [Agriterribacter sp.]